MKFSTLSDRIVYVQEGKTFAEVVFNYLAGNSVEITRTWVDDSLRGQGVASQLLSRAAKLFLEQGTKVIPSCSYARDWFDKHDEYSHLVL